MAVASDDLAERELAIEVVDARKSYGSLEVLKGLYMDVLRGSIYGLLGSSGCGKTTLLRCILGRLQLASGSVLVFGRQPGTMGHNVPGRGVGYMPQELALYGDFTLLETMHYFGILHGMKRAEVKQRARFLTELLELPSKGKSIKKLSGGQQRRASFAIALLQQPPLLILDEPTVGVDPLLRAKIWEHLLDLVATQHTSIVITTHYIEEARQAHTVGLMRDGCLLAQSDPRVLIQSYGMSTLEEVFLSLCRRQDDDKEREEASVGMVTSIQSNFSDSTKVCSQEIDETMPLLRKSTSPGRKRSRSEITESIHAARADYCPSRASCRPAPCNFHHCLPWPMNILALCWKNFVHIYRNPGLLFFQFVVPALQVALFCLAVGRNLTGVSTVLVNEDTGFVPNGTLCNSTNMTLGKDYIDVLKADSTFSLQYFDNMELAISQVKQAKAWAVIGIGSNFSADLIERAKDPFQQRIPPPSVINGSTIHLYMDVTNVQITVVIENRTQAAFELFLNDLLGRCKIPNSSSLVAPPIKIHQPAVYGRLDLSFTDYMGPGIITSVILGISIGLTAVVLVVERKEGLIDRTWVAGVNVSEMIISQVLTQFFILLVQIILVVVVIVYAFKVYNADAHNLFIIGLLALLQGLTGMALGLVISSLCTSESSALQFAIAAFYPAVLLSGVIWPLEGMPVVLRYISFILPATFPAQAMRAIMGRGWSLSEYEVWRGFLVTIAWFVLLLVVAGVGLRLRK